MSLARSFTPVVRVSARQVARPQGAASFRSLRQPVRFSSTVAASPVHSHTPMWIVLGVLVGGGAAMYVYVKPIRELASKASATMDSAKESGNQAADFASQAASLAGLGPAFQISKLAFDRIQSQGGLSTFLTSLSTDIQNSDANAALKKLRSVGGKELEPYVAKAEKALKDAGGKMGDVDWKTIIDEMKAEVGEDLQGLLSFISAYLPASGPIVAALATGDFTKIAQKIKDQGGDQLKDLEKSASALYQKAQDAMKDSKGDVAGTIKKLQELDGDDLDKVLKQVKELAKKSGIPADTIESWIADKGGKIDTEKLTSQVKSYAQTGKNVAEKAVGSVDTDKVVSSIKVVSPSLASLVALALSSSGADLGKEGEKAKGDGKAQFEAMKKKLEGLTGILKGASSVLPKDLQARLEKVTASIEKISAASPSISDSASAAKDSAKKGEKTPDAKDQEKQWKEALDTMRKEAKVQLDGVLADLEKAAEGKGEVAKKAVEAVKSYVQ